MGGRGALRGVGLGGVGKRELKESHERGNAVGGKLLADQNLLCDSWVGPTSKFEFFSNLWVLRL